MDAPTPTAARRAAAATLAAGAFACAVVALLLLAPAASAKKRDRLPPRIRTAVTRDANGNGHVDGILLTYSEKVKTKGGPGKRAFRVAGYTVTSTRRAAPTAILLSLREKAAYDTGARPAIAYAQQRKMLRAARKKKRKRRAKRKRNPDYRQAVFDRAGNQAFAGSYRTVADRVSPRLVSARTDDANVDGHIDGVLAAFSEPMPAPARSAATAAGRSVTAVSSSKPDTIRVAIAPSPLTDTDARPKLSFSASLADAARNRLAGGQSRTPDDGSAPVLVGAVTADAGGTAGKLDQTQLNFSEPVGHAADSDGAYPLAVAGYAIASVGAASGPSVTAALTEGSGYDTGARPAVTYTRGRGAAVTDGAGLEAVTRTFQGTGDGASPVLVAGRTDDADGNAKIDRVAAVFSETVTYPGGGSDFAVGGRTISNVAAAAAGQVGLTIAEVPGPSTYDTDDRPSLTYTASSTHVVDAAGRFAASRSIGQSDDGARPVLVSARTADSNHDGKLDGVDLGYSESVSHAADSIAPFPVSVAGKQVSSVGAADGAQVGAGLAPGAVPDSGDAPNVVYATGADVAIRDPAGNEARNQTYQATEDKARPVMVSAVTGEDGATADGFIDFVTTEWSEPIDRGGDTSNGGTFTVQSPYGAGAGALGIGDTTIQVPVTRSGGPKDRGGDPLFNVVYNSGSGTAVRDKAAPPNDAWPDSGQQRSVQARAVCSDDSREQDDSEPAAASIPNTKTIATLCGGELDWSKFTLSNGQDLQLVVGAGAGIDTLPTLNKNGSPAGTLNDRGTGQDDTLTDSCATLGGCEYTLRVEAQPATPPVKDDIYCTNWSTAVATPVCGVKPGDLVVTEVANNGASSFVELKNVTNTDLDIQNLTISDTSGTTCTIRSVSDPGSSTTNVTLLHGQYAWGDDTTQGDFTCAPGGSVDVAQSGEKIDVKDQNLLIDTADLRGADPAPASSHSLELGRYPEDADENDTLLDAANPTRPANWCYTFDANTREGTQAERQGDRCQRFVVNEVLSNPTGSDDGGSFVELRGNASAVSGSKLLGGYVLVRFQAASIAGGTPEMELALPANADPGPDGFYVVADSTSLGVTTVPVYDIAATNLDPADGDISIQLLRPNPPASSCPAGTEADAVAMWASAHAAADGKRGCATVEDQPTLVGIGAGEGISASRVEPIIDTDQNQIDFDQNYNPSPGSGSVKLTPN